MPARLQSEFRSKAAVSVSEMARMCDLSRSHFHALVRAGVMPQPIYCVQTRRPLFDRNLQELCLAVRATNIGIDGRYVMFYARREHERTATRPHTRRNAMTRGSPARHADLRGGLEALGMASVTDAQIDAALMACFPNGTDGVDEGQALRSVWQHLRRMNVA